MLNTRTKKEETEKPENEEMVAVFDVIKDLGQQFLANDKLAAIKENELERVKEILQSEENRSDSQLEWRKFIVLIVFMAFCITVAAVCFLIKDLPPALNSIICFVAGYSAALVIVPRRQKVKSEDTN